MGSYGNYCQCAARIRPDSMSDPTSCICFSSIFPKKAWIRLCKTDLNPILVRVRVWPDTSGPEANRCAGIIWPGFWQDATRFCYSTGVLDNIVQNQPGSDLVLAKRIQSRSKPLCKKHPARFWPMLPSQSRPDANQIQHVYWVSIAPVWVHSLQRQEISWDSQDGPPPPPPPPPTHTDAV